MNQSVKAYRYRLPLKRSLQLRRSVCDYRDGILLYADGQWAEASPLTGFSQDTAEDVIAGLQTRGGESPALSFGLDALCRKLKPCSVPINSLLQGEASDVLRQCEIIADSAFLSVKLKVGRTDPSAAAELVHGVCRLLRSDQKLRLDANRGWTFEQAIGFAQSIEGCEIEYIEEPLQDNRRLDDFYERTGVPYALDETVSEQPILDGFRHAAALVFKPTCSGGRERVEDLKQLGKPIVFSSTFESGIGIARIAQLAHEFSPETPSGLDTYSWLKDDVLTRPLTVKGGRITVPDEFEIDYEMLEEIEF